MLYWNEKSAIMASSGSGLIRQRILAGVIAGLITVVSVCVQADPFTSWSFKMKITFAGYDGTETLTNFPALVVFTNGMSSNTFFYSQFAATNGYDLRFKDSNDVELSYQIEEWNPAGNSYVWVKVPQLVNNSSYIWACWGRARATAPGYTTDGSTWANGFVGVWHLNEDGTGARLDSSPNNNDGIPCAYSGAEATVGLIGGADNLDGIANCIRIPNNAGLQLNERLSLSAWVKADIWDTVNENAIIRKSSGYRFLCRDTGFMTLKLESAPDVIVQDPIANYSAGAWYHLVATYDKDANIASLYTNGVLAASTPGNTWLLSNDTDDPYIGSTDGAGQFFNGIIDEARICNVARSADWVWATYMTMASNATFTTYGTRLSQRSTVLMIR
jgi:hypothetical protein